MPDLLNRQEQSLINPAPVGDAERGADIFKVGIDNSPPCSSCHQYSQNGYSLGIGPSLIGISEHASQRIEGVSAQDYLRNSIFDPQSYVVPGYNVDMYSGYREYFTEQDIADLIAFLMGL